MATRDPVEFTASDDDMLFYSYGLFGSDDSDHRNECIPWIATKFQHHSLEAWTERFNALMKGLSKAELKKQVERAGNEFDISGYVSDLHNRGIEPHVKDDGGDQDDEDSDVEIVSDYASNDEDDDEDDDDILNLRPKRPKRKSRGEDSSPYLTEAQIKAQLELDFPEMAAGNSRARQSRRYVERELGHVSLVHQQLTKLKMELTTKLKEIDRGLGYGGLGGQMPAVGFWGNDGSANGGAEDPVISETDAIMHDFWNSYVSRYQRERGTSQESLSRPGSLLGQKRAVGDVSDVSGEVDEPRVKKPRNGTVEEEEEEEEEEHGAEDEAEEEEDGADEEAEEEEAQPDNVDDLSDESNSEVAEVEVEEEEVSQDMSREVSQDMSREESRELEESILAESDSDLSEPPSDAESSEEEEEKEEEEEPALKPVPKDWKVVPPHVDIDDIDEEEEEEEDEGEENGEEENGEEDNNEEDNNEDQESQDDEDEEAIVIDDESDGYDESEDEKPASPVPTTTSRRRSAGRANYREIPPGVDDDEEDSEEEVEEVEEDDEEDFEEEASSRTRRTRPRGARRGTRRVVSEDDDDDDDESEEESSEESDYKSKPKRPARRSRQVEESESEESDYKSKPKRRSRKVEESASEEESEEDGSDDDSEDEDEETAKSAVEEPKEPRSLSDIFLNNKKDRVSLFADSQSDGSSASESDEFVEIVAVPKTKSKVTPRKRIGPVASLASSRGRARARPKFESSSEESSSEEPSEPELDDDSDDDLSDEDSSSDSE